MTTIKVYGKIRSNSFPGNYTPCARQAKQVFRGTQRPNLSKDVRSVVNGFLYVLEGFLVNLEMP